MNPYILLIHPHFHKTKRHKIQNYPKTMAVPSQVSFPNDEYIITDSILTNLSHKTLLESEEATYN